MNANEKLTVLVVEPMTPPYVKELDKGFRSLQNEVGGTFSATYPFAEQVALVVHDEGKLIGLPPNRALRDEQGNTYDIVCGTFLVVGLGEEDFTSLTPEQIDTYTELYAKEWLIPMPKEPKMKGNKTYER